MVVLGSDISVVVLWTAAACRVAVLGAEAADTSALSAALAARFGVPLVSAAELLAAAAENPSNSAGEV